MRKDMHTITMRHTFAELGAEVVFLPKPKHVALASFQVALRPQHAQTSFYFWPGASMLMASGQISKSHIAS